MKSPDASGSVFGLPGYSPRGRCHSAPDRSSWNTVFQMEAGATFVRVVTRVRSGASGVT